MSNQSRAERAGQAAKVARRRRRERERVVGWTAVAFFGLPLLFAAVWCRMEVCEELHRRDELLARRDVSMRANLKLTGTKSRLSVWESLEPQARALGLAEPTSDQVVWVPITNAEDGR